ncbi:MurF [Desulforapulum autotrophicum HRM2]|uniref:UDP-N-acetylmuramoyl-tripeptide--D-alanyl-D-alanine ligase n=1 Tax=Desulforapulum autotrophicum (strain ATCC 43914 / DSM 3382 / VKM B-1955 / HRM2) TaxID=177437 RepID=C0Q8N9_DESAH|nr:UDP-N-acetylmuramoyl-tripeptide--D-alanyl-D-alanine ligase [Desulforapulum autotrophicum]ACN14379.1 MurF [Desulforapulum autotrophicum HRM2]
MNRPIPWRVADIAKALGQGPTHTVTEIVFSGVSTDSRTIGVQDLFVALEGERFDGHTFIADLVKRGVRGFVVKKGQKIPKDVPGCLFFSVDNTLTALGDLARFQRLRAGVRVVAITGSNGKTSTRKMTGEIFGRKFNTLTTRGNLNNEIGLPLTLLGLSLDHEWAVVEMGMNHGGEIHRLGSIALPDIGVITNTSHCHLEGLGTVEGVARAKAELLPHVRVHGSAVLNLDDPRFPIFSAAVRANTAIENIVCFSMDRLNMDCVGASAIADREEGMGFTLVSPSEGTREVFLHTPARFMVSNALAAAGAALAAGISMDVIKQGLEAFEPEPGRMHLEPGFNHTTIIDDTYNANPGSVGAALETLERVTQNGVGIAVLGDMLELGPGTEQFHREMGALAAASGISRLYAHGPMADHVIHGAVKAGFPGSAAMTGTRDEIAADLLAHTPENAWILVKGSRGMRLEKIVSQLKRTTTIAGGGKMDPSDGN